MAKRKGQWPGDPLTPSQERVYKAIVYLYRSLNRPVAWGEISELIYRKRQTRYFSYQIRALREKGYISPCGPLVPLDLKPEVRITGDSRIRVFVMDQVLSAEEATELAGELIEAAQQARRQAGGLGSIFGKRTRRPLPNNQSAK